MTLNYKITDVTAKYKYIIIMYLHIDSVMGLFLEHVMPVTATVFAANRIKLSRKSVFSGGKCVLRHRKLNGPASTLSVGQLYRFEILGS